MSERRVLLVSYYFPPDAAVGGLRISKFARCLPEFGWRPVVLTVDDKHRDQGLDHERMAGLDGVPIETAGTWPGLLPTLAALKSRIVGQRTRPVGAGAPAAAAPVGAAEPSESFRGRVKRSIAAFVVLLPDDKKKWALSATLATLRMIRKHDVACVLTSSPPPSLHLAGLVAKALTGVTWVADLRDPWLETVLNERPASDRTATSDRIERWMERLVVTRADKVITTTARLRDSLRERYPEQPAAKFVSVPNSIDTEKFATADAAKYEPMTITYTGTLYIDRTPEPLFRAVGELLRNGLATTADIRIKLVGTCDVVNGVDTRVLADRHGVGAVVEIQGLVPQTEAIRIMQQSHLLLVLAPGHHRYMVPAKMYDYLGSGTPVLAIAEDGATRDLIADTRCGRCFSHDDIEGLRDYLRDLLADGAYRRLGNDPARFAQFDARSLTGHLAAELTSVRRGGRERTVLA